jgi:hypothetical protein
MLAEGGAFRSHGVGIGSAARKESPAAERLGARISAASSVNLCGQLPPSVSHFFQDLSVPFRLGYAGEPAALIRKLSTLSWRRYL